MKEDEKHKKKSHILINMDEKTISECQASISLIGQYIKESSYSDQVKSSLSPVIARQGKDLVTGDIYPVNNGRIQIEVPGNSGTIIGFDEEKSDET